jgi:probable HAF family extracellular repeat protein
MNGECFASPAATAARPDAATNCALPSSNAGMICNTVKPQLHRLLATVVGFALPLHAQSYVVNDLGPGIANDINLSGHVVGTSDGLGFVYDGSTRRVLTNLTFAVLANPFGGPPSVLGPTSSTAVAINDADRILGTMWRDGFPNAGAYLYDGTNTDGFVYAPEVTAMDVNVSGRVVGWGVFSSSPSGPFSNAFARGDEHPVDLDHYSRLNAVNSAGVAVGSRGNPGPTFDTRSRSVRGRAMTVSTSGAVTNLDTRPLPDELISNFDNYSADANHWSDAYGINDSGVVVGVMLLSVGGPRHAFRHAGSGLEDLGTLGGTNSAARGVNAAGDIVGEADLPDGTTHAFRHSNGVLIDLNTLLPAGSGWELLSARAINSRGEMVGQGRFQGGLHAFVLSPAGLINPPRIDLQPVGARLAFGQGFTLSVGAAGVSPITYQWTRNGTNIAGATGATLAILAASAADVGDYRVLVTNGGGTVPSTLVRIDVLDPELTAESYVGLRIVGAVGASYRIEYRPSANAAEWTTVTNLTLTSSPQRWVDLESVNLPSRIYHAVRLP